MENCANGKKEAERIRKGKKMSGNGGEFAVIFGELIINFFLIISIQA